MSISTEDALMVMAADKMQELRDEVARLKGENAQLRVQVDLAWSDGYEACRLDRGETLP